MVEPIKRKVPKGALERIDELEKLIPNLLSSINEALLRVDNRVSELADVIEVIGDKIGKEEVLKLLQERREARDMDNAVKAQEALQKAVEAGVAVAVDTVSEKSLVVGVEYDKDGKAIPPARVQLMFTQIKPEVREKLAGNGPGTKVETPAGGTFEVLEVYNLVDQAAKTDQAPTPAAPTPTAPTPTTETVTDTASVGA